MICTRPQWAGAEYDGPIELLPVTNQPSHRSAALIDHLARLMRVGAEAALTPLGLRPRHLVALTVLRDHGEATQQSLSAALQIDRTNLVGLLNDLEEEGLAVRRRSPEDRRRHIVTLTALGAERLAQAELALTAVEGDLLGALDEEERETLYRLLQRATGGHVGGCTEAAAPAPAVCLEHPADCD